MKPDLDEAAYSIGRAALRVARRAILELAKFRLSYDNPITMELLETAREALGTALAKDHGDAAALAEARRRVTAMLARLDALGVE